MLLLTFRMFHNHHNRPSLFQSMLASACSLPEFSITHSKTKFSANLVFVSSGHLVRNIMALLTILLRIFDLASGKYSTNSSIKRTWCSQQHSQARLLLKSFRNSLEWVLHKNYTMGSTQPLFYHELINSFKFTPKDSNQYRNRFKILSQSISGSSQMTVQMTALEQCCFAADTDNLFL